jgi:hypothetical protein
MTAATSTAHEPTGEVTRAPGARTRAAGLGLVAGAIALAIAESLHPQSNDDLLTGFSEEPGRWTAWALLIMATGMCCLPGVVAWHARARRRGSRLTTAGAIILGAALVALFSFGESNGEAVALAGSAQPVPAEVIAAYARVDSTSVPLFVMFLIAIPGFHLGLPIFLAGLARAGLIRWWLAAVGGTAAVLSIFVGGLHPLLGPAAFVVVAATLAVLGFRLLKASS